MSIERTVSYRGWTIRSNEVSYHPSTDFVGVHDDYDPTPQFADDPPADDRLVHGRTIQEVKERIDEYETELEVFRCVDCGTNTMDEYYMVHDEVWSAAGMKKDGGMLCIGCLEGRLGRSLSAADFSPVPINHMPYVERSARLSARLAVDPAQRSA